ncbi:MAG TPA: glucosyl-3-phosphoglycerate synthase [Blastocatellia bacterium]|nr:glucosyl-3-phosphoglycerate synthase [Blastocatellia bacterium]
MIHTIMQDLVSRKPSAVLRDLNVLVPAEDVAAAERVLPLAISLSGSAKSTISLIGVTPVGRDVSLSEGAVSAQRLRNDLETLASENARINRLAGSFVSHQPWEDIEALIDERMLDNDLLLLAWQQDKTYFQADLAEVLRDPPCNIAVVNPMIDPRDIRRILLPVRGGPFANLSLQLAIRLARSANAEVTLLRVVSSDDDPMSQVLREKFTGLSDAFPEITTELQIVGDAGTAVVRALKDHQAIILGASAAHDGPPIGLMASIILQRKDVTTLLVKTKEPFRLPASTARRANLPVLVRVEKWFAENTFHSREFSDIDRLIDLKRQQNLRISLGLPALNQESTIGNLIHSIKRKLMDDAPLLDEIVLIDGNSTDFTRKVAAELGVPPYIHQEILPRLGSVRGRGESLWKSLYLLKGDLIVWLDTDIVNPHTRIVYGILGPLLMNSHIQYVKGFYRRTIRSNGEALSAGAGTVTELLARPMINLFFPDLSGLIEPLAGIYGGRRSALEQVPFYTGPGVEAGLLLDLLEKFGLKSIAQVDLEDVEYRSQDERAFGKMSFAILQVFAQHLKQKGLMDAEAQIERTMKLLRVEEDRFYLEEIDVHEQQRPPIIEVTEYRGRYRPRLS